MQAIKGACVAFCGACAASCGLLCIYSVVARSGGFPGAFWAFRGYGPRVMFSAFCVAFKGSAGPPEYINQWPQLPCILGAFWGRLRAFRASAGILFGLHLKAARRAAWRLVRVLLARRRLLRGISSAGSVGPPAAAAVPDAFGVVACCFPPVGAASLVNLLQVLLWFRPSFGFVFGRLRRVSCSRCIYTC